MNLEDHPTVRWFREQKAAGEATATSQEDGGVAQALTLEAARLRAICLEAGADAPVSSRSTARRWQASGRGFSTPSPAPAPSSGWSTA